MYVLILLPVLLVPMIITQILLLISVYNVQTIVPFVVTVLLVPLVILVIWYKVTHLPLVSHVDPSVMLVLLLENVPLLVPLDILLSLLPTFVPKLQLVNQINLITTTHVLIVTQDVPYVLMLLPVLLVNQQNTLMLMVLVLTVPLLPV